MTWDICMYMLLAAAAFITEAEDVGQAHQGKSDWCDAQTEECADSTLEEGSQCLKPVDEINFSVRKNNVVDLTHSFDENSAFWPNNPAGFRLIERFKGLIKGPVSFFYSDNTFSQPEHLGTHLDAPIHFSETGVGVDEVSLYNLIGPGVLVNLKVGGEKIGRDSLVSIEDFHRWERENGGPIRTGSIVIIYTGYSDVYNDREEYYGTDMIGEDSIPHLHFPGLDPDAAEWLVTRRCIAAVGIDTASIDRGQSRDMRSHRILTANSVPFFENVANLDRLSTESKDFKIIALPQKIRGGSGAPLRIIAITN